MRATRGQASRRERASTRGAAWLLGLVLTGLVWLGAGAAAAVECAGGELLPDFNCDREVRPEGHVAPMSMPYLFEDPYITTELNLVGIYHNFPSDSVFQGGEAGVIALQARLALTDRLGFIATKDGYTILRPDNGFLENEEGFMDVTIGFKYAAIDDREKGLIVSPSLRYEIPLGSDDMFQGRGDGVFIPAVSASWGPNDVHFIADLGAQIPIDGDQDSTSLFYNFHLDKAFEADCIPGARFVVPFIELNGMSWVDSGDGSATVDLRDGNPVANRAPLKAAQDVLFGAGITSHRRFEGADIANLGSSNMAGETLITMAWGVRVPFDNGISTGFSYERVLSQRQDIFEQRATWMVSYTF
ncbi:MAG: transporter [Spirochaetaceae bacterium]|nr:transporter [Myxococcales bacterium]MCB9726218.1 transporter [Spirochaetaceae bacterium]